MSISFFFFFFFFSYLRNYGENRATTSFLCVIPVTFFYFCIRLENIILLIAYLYFAIHENKPKYLLTYVATIKTKT